MSKGLGWLQRRLLEFLESSDEAWTTMDLVEAVFGEDAAYQSQYVSVYRSLRKLAGAGRIRCLDREKPNYACYWASPETYAGMCERRRKGETEEKERERALLQFIAEMKRDWGLHMTPEEALRLFREHYRKEDEDQADR